MYPSVKEIDTSVKKLTLGHDLGAGSACLKCGPACPGLDLHYWRKICKNCKCKQDDHDVKIEDNDHVRKIGHLFDKSTRQQYTINKMTVPQNAKLNKPEPTPGKRDSSNQVTFEWIPQGTSDELAQRYMESLPKESQPIKGTAGAQTRNQAMQRQLPDHDQHPEACHNLTEKEKEKMNEFVQTYKDQAVGIGEVEEINKPKSEGGVQTPASVATQSQTSDSKSKWKCKRCQEPMAGGDVAVFAERAGPETCWHPACFRCKTCNELLVDLIYFYKDNEIFCGRHYSDLLKPRCSACDELIFASSYTQAEDQNWHLKHFCCFECDDQLGGKSYVAKNSHPYCLPCHEKLFAKVCNTCKQKIAAGAQRVSYEELHWHAHEDCFHCSNCKKTLINQSFLPKQNYIFCSVQCKRQLLSQEQNPC